MSRTNGSIRSAGRRRALAGVALLAGAAALVTGWHGAVAQKSGAPDLVLVNGRIATVDDQFRFVQALAVTGERITATGSNGDIRRLASPTTRIIDLQGRTVIPGLIDNHSHWIRAAEHNELRFDGITSRRQALKLLAERVRTTPPGEWISVLGGWSEEQFLDEPRGFPMAEIDAIAPNHPVVLQAVYNHSYLNTAALRAAKIDESTPNPPGGTIEKDAAGRLTGMVRGAGGVAFVAARIPLKDRDAWLENTRRLVADLNAMGITGWMDAGGRGMSARHYEPYAELARRGELNARVYWTTIRQPATPEQVDKVVAEIATLRPFQGNDMMNHVGYGESLYGPATTQLLRKGGNLPPEAVDQAMRIVRAVAERGMYLNAHVEMEDAIEAYLAGYEKIAREVPIRGLRWSYSHLDQVTNAQLDRMKRLGMTAQIHTRPLIQGVLMHRVHGERAWDMPPFRRVQDSGILWGLGSDATAVTTSNPFYSLGFAVTGKMVGGHHVNRSTVTREEALIAHTRSNAFIVFQESNLGSLTPGRYADLLVLDRDYFRVPADQIKDIRPLITMVNGRIVHDTMPRQ